MVKNNPYLLAAQAMEDGGAKKTKEKNQSLPVGEASSVKHAAGARVNAAAAAERAAREKEVLEKLKLESDALVQAVEESSLLQKYEKREYPTFQRSEIIIGPLLGMGGFGIVYEVKDIQLKQQRKEDQKAKEQPIPEQATSDTTTLPAASSSSPDLAAGPSTTTKEGPTEPKRKGEEEEEKRQASTSFAVEKEVEEKEEDDDHHDDIHYDVSNAREFMCANVRRKKLESIIDIHDKGDARYAIKRLHQDLTEMERTRGSIDMAIEAKFLSVLNHPNIVKMRGVAEGPILDRYFFILMDRLYQTLAEKITEWNQSFQAAKGCFFGVFGSNKDVLTDLLVQRLVVAYDIAAAFAYMHEHQLVYRDIKKENFGFDVRGDVKVFDFGLAKCLEDDLKAKNEKTGKDVYGYNLTPRTGSIPFMAPEVALCQPYDEKVDVFSFAILLWEMMSLKTAFPNISRYEFLEQVVKKGERPTIPNGSSSSKNKNYQWPSLTRLLVKEAWDTAPTKRPDMKRVCTLLRGDLNDMSQDPSIQNRTFHMRNRSAHSIRGASRFTGSMQMKEKTKQSSHSGPKSSHNTAF